MVFSPCCYVNECFATDPVRLYVNYQVRYSNMLPLYHSINRELAQSRKSKSGRETRVQSPLTTEAEASLLPP